MFNSSSASRLTARSPPAGVLPVDSQVVRPTISGSRNTQFRKSDRLRPRNQGSIKRDATPRYPGSSAAYVSVAGDVHALQ